MSALKIIGAIIIILVIVVIAGGYYFLHLLQTGGISIPVNVVQATGIGQYLNVSSVQEPSLLSNSTLPSPP